MAQTTPLSKTSFNIAKYVVENGTNPYQVPGHFQVDKMLSDGRSLRLYFCNVAGKGIEEIAQNARLEISLSAAKKDQIGYETREWGLTGKLNDWCLEEFRIYLGNDYWVHISPGGVGFASEKKVEGDEYENFKTLIAGFKYEFLEKLKNLVDKNDLDKLLPTDKSETLKTIVEEEYEELKKKILSFLFDETGKQSI